MTKNEPKDPLLGASLKKARIDTGLTQEQLAAQAGWEPGTGKFKASKIESGRQIPTAKDLDDWARVTAVHERLKEQWKQMAAAADAARAASYKSRLGGGQSPVQQEWTDRAKVTTRFRFFETFVIPRYLQVAEYTRAVLEEFKTYSTIEDLDKAVGDRQESVRFLYDSSKAFKLLIDEPVLRRRRFPPSVMLPQLLFLQSALGLPSAQIRIYPSLTRPVSYLTPSSFELFDDRGFIEDALGGRREFLYDSVADLEAKFDRMWEEAAAGDEARQIIVDAISSLPAG